MSRDAYAAWLRRLSAADLEGECATRISLHRDHDQRERWRDETRGHYGLCWAECCDRGRKDLWNAALETVRQELRKRDRGNAEALARFTRAKEEDLDVANVNKVIFVGRLTRDPETRTFTNGGAVAQFGFAVSNRKKNPSTGQWEDEPMFIDCKVFNRGENGQQADRVQQTLHKGNQVFLEGHLVLEQWDDKQSGQKRSKHVLIVDNFQYLEPRQDGGQASQAAPSRTYSPRGQPLAPAGAPPQYDDGDGLPAGAEEIPF